MIEIHEDIVKKINASGLESFGKFNHINTEHIDDLLSNGTINTVDHGNVLLLKKYIKVYSMTKDEAEKIHQNNGMM